MHLLRFTVLSILLFIALSCHSQTQGSCRSTDSSLIFYRSFGTGEPLLIINGGPGMNSDGFEGLAVKLSKNRQTIIYDQRGTGRSVLPKTDASTITMKLMIDDIECLRKHLHIDQWSVLGHSFGGMLASYYATQYPAHIKSMILSSSGGIDLGLLSYVSESINAKLGKTALDSINYWVNKISAGDTSHYARLQRGRLLAPAYLYDQKYIPVIAERLTQGNTNINNLVWQDLQKIHYDCAEKLKGFDQPVLIIQGKQDIMRPETAEKAHRVLKNSRIVYLDHCGHYGWLDNEEVYLREVNAFLNKI